MKSDKYLAFSAGEITVYCSKSVRENVQCSLLQASRISKSERRGNTLYINTAFSTRKLYEAARRDMTPAPEDKLGKSEGIYFKNVIIGDLPRHFDEYRELIEQHDIKHIIVNSWEFANRSYGYKEKALFGLMGFAKELNLSVLIYSQAKMETAIVGEMHRGGLGKLAAIADDIIWASYEADEIQQKAESEKLSPMKINELDYAHGEMSISEFGELESPKLMEKEAILTNGLRVRSTGVKATEKPIPSQKSKHIPMSNKNRALLAEYEKTNGKAQLPGESFRDMFDRVLGKILSENSAIWEPGERVREMLS